MGFWGGCDAGSVQRLLTVDSGAATSLADLVPGSSGANRQIVALAHSDTYGGAGGTFATASGGNALSSLITPHEIGHSLGKLQDEYDYYARGVAGGAYEGGEPSSAHHTLLTAEQMTQQRASGGAGSASAASRAGSSAGSRAGCTAPRASGGPASTRS